MPHPSMRGRPASSNDQTRSVPPPPQAPQLQITTREATHNSDTTPRKRKSEENTAMAAEGSMAQQKRLKKTTNLDEGASPQQQLSSKSSASARKHQQSSVASSSAPKPQVAGKAASKVGIDDMDGASTRAHYNDHEPHSHATVFRALDTMRAELAKKQHDIDEQQASLQAEREIMIAERQTHKDEKTKMKMDMVLDKEIWNRNVEKEKSALRREKYHLAQERDDNLRVISDMERDIQSQNNLQRDLSAKLSRSKAELDRVKVNHGEERATLERREAELEGEIDRLRQLFIEEREIIDREKKFYSLPPAYGSLDEEANKPPYEQHEDGGTLDIAVLKRTVRDQFQQRLTVAQAERDRMRNDATLENQEEACKRAHCDFFYAMSDAFLRAVEPLKDALRVAEHIAYVYIMGKDANRFRANPSPTEVREWKRCTARRTYVADRIAKIMIDMAWRIDAACEVYPSGSTAADFAKELPIRTRLALVWKEVDDFLLYALSGSFSESNDEMMFDCETYSVQLRSMAIVSQADIGFKYFFKSIEWLEGQVQTLRATRAPVTLPVTVPSSTLNPGVAAWANLGANGSGGALAAAFEATQVDDGTAISSDGHESDGESVGLIDASLL